MLRCSAQLIFVKFCHLKGFACVSTVTFKVMLYNQLLIEFYTNCVLPIYPQNGHIVLYLVIVSGNDDSKL